jgi:hypothetical protein
MLGEHDPRDVRCRKTKQALAAMKPLDRARFLCDTIAFVALSEEASGLGTRIRGRVKSCGRDAGTPEWFATELVISMQQYGSSEIAEYGPQWVKQFIAGRATSALPPPFMLPFAWELAVIDDESLSQSVMTFESALLVIVLEEVENESKPGLLPLDRV